MNVATTLLALLLGGGGLGGLAVLIRVRTDKGATVVETVSKGVLVMERINDRLERELTEEHAARIAAETALSEHMRRCHAPVTPGGSPDGR